MRGFSCFHDCHLESNNANYPILPYWCCHWLSHPGLAKFVFGLELMVVARAVDVRKMHVHVLILILSMSKLWAKGFPFHLVLFVLDVTLNSPSMLQSDDDT